jgi:integrase
MSSRNISQAEPMSALSLADLLAKVAASNLPERKRQELSSAIRTAARALGRLPENVPADGRLLAGRLKDVEPAATGISRGRWANIRSLLRTALAVVQPISPGRHQNDLRPEWLALWNELTSKSDKIALSRVLRFCSARGITPNAVTKETFDDFHLHLERSLLKRPSQTFAMTVRAWQRVRAAIPGWPQLGVSIPDRRKQWVSGWDCFPDALRRDCQAWLDRLAGRDLVEDEVSFRPVRPVTLAHREWQIRAFASALVRMGRDAATLTSLSDLVEIDAFKTGLRCFLDRAGGAPTTGIADLASSLKAVARHYVRVGPDHLQRMGAIIGRLSPGRRGLTETNMTRLRPFNEQENVSALLALPRELMRQARRHRNPQRGAVRAQMAVAIEILLMAPIRMRNLVNLDIEQHLVRSVQGGVLHIVIEAEDVKNEEPLEHPLPLESAALIDTYIEKFRPRLSSKNGTALFPGIDSDPKNQDAFGTQISRTVRAHTGLRVNPHLFRHLGAKLYLDANPGDYETVRRVLGHRSLQTTIDFYTGLETPAAARHFDKTILNLRTESTAGSPRRSKRKTYKEPEQVK